MGKSPFESFGNAAGEDWFSRGSGRAERFDLDHNSIEGSPVPLEGMETSPHYSLEGSNPQGTAEDAHAFDNRYYIDAFDWRSRTIDNFPPISLPSNYIPLSQYEPEFEGKDGYLQISHLIAPNSISEDGEFPLSLLPVALEAVQKRNAAQTQDVIDLPLYPEYGLEIIVSEFKESGKIKHALEISRQLAVGVPKPLSNDQLLVTPENIDAVMKRIMYSRSLLDLKPSADVSSAPTPAP